MRSVPDPGPFREGAVEDLATLLDAFNRRRAQRGWTFRDVNVAVGANLDLNSMIRNGNATGKSLFKIAEALGLEISVRVKPALASGRRGRARFLREQAHQSATEPAGGSGE